MGYVEELRALVGTRPLIFVGAVVIITDSEGRILLQERQYPPHSWGLPGGLMELGESTEETARREVYEEMNIELGRLELLKVYSGPDQFVMAANGDEFYVVIVAYHTGETTGKLIVDETESKSAAYIQVDELPDGVVKSHRKIIEDFLDK
ncbi:NUDIX hydrolase [Evansella cellulosilytica]|uniref:NUDIX hydrolase n=1 Tax=Evansella cellulosilytica (strain ATCC 21833 / DSM 2522 / FERM P-1141 / JCM 9156 / N-4) TaxID=649639 RepID=E6TYE8_EVAC2|nr:NUDIX hydrolase [Evansella cellulosilytica]ADU28886.1 NUDIX hydrolase [Evansella cellulosilytica DSM 2522]